jgi:hypothetical protein
VVVVTVDVLLVVVVGEVTVLELPTRYPTAPDKITRTRRMTTQVICPNADSFDIANKILLLIDELV